MNTLTVLLLASFAALATASTPKWDSCQAGGKDPLVVPSSVELDPLVSNPGGTVTFKIAGSNNYGTITDGDFKVTVIDHLCVSYHGVFKRCHDVTVYTETKSICDRAECPIKEGPVEFEYIKHLPPITPPGLYKIHIEATRGEDLLICMIVEFLVQRKHHDDYFQLAKAS